MIVEVSKLKHSLHLLNATHKVYYKGNEMTIDELLLLRTVTILKFIATQKLLIKKSLINVYGEKQYEDQEKDLILLGCWLILINEKLKT